MRAGICFMGADGDGELFLPEEKSWERKKPD